MEMPAFGACVSRKLCTLLGLQEGDTITMYLTGDDDPVRLPITAIA